MNKTKARYFKIRQRLVERVPFSLALLGVLAGVLILLYLLGYINQIDTTYPHTYFRPVNQSGTLTTQRLVPIWWIALLGSIFRLAFMFMTITRVALYKEPWVINMHIFATVLFLVQELAGTVLYGLEYDCCNNSPNDGDCSGENNLCNDYRWCCQYGHLTQTCPNYAQPAYNCTPNVTVAELKPNVEFVISFATSLSFAVLGIVALFLSYSARKTLLVKREYMGQLNVMNDDDFLNVGGAFPHGNEDVDDDDDPQYTNVGGKHGRSIDLTILNRQDEDGNGGHHPFYTGTNEYKIN